MNRREFIASIPLTWAAGTAVGNLIKKAIVAKRETPNRIKWSFDSERYGTLMRIEGFDQHGRKVREEVRLLTTEPQDVGTFKDLENVRVTPVHQPRLVRTAGELADTAGPR